MSGSVTGCTVPVLAIYVVLDKNSQKQNLPHYEALFIWSEIFLISLLDSKSPNNRFSYEEP